jgi:hypothetical protein
MTTFTGSKHEEAASPEDAIVGMAQYAAGIWVEGVRAWARLWFNAASILTGALANGSLSPDAMRSGYGHPRLEQQHQD